MEWAVEWAGVVAEAWAKVEVWDRIVAADGRIKEAGRALREAGA